MENLKNVHSKQDIYVICSGKSLEFIEPDFFDGKITVGINQVDKYFKPTYIVRKEYTGDIKLDESVTLVLSKYKCGDSGELNKVENRSGVYYFDHDPNKHTVIDGLPADNKIIVSYSTVTSGLHLAAFMGAKNIILIGHDCGSLDGEMNFKGYHTQDTLSLAWGNDPRQQQIRYAVWASRHIEDQTIKVKHLLKEKYGCNIYSLNPFINFNLENHVYRKV